MQYLFHKFLILLIICYSKAMINEATNLLLEKKDLTFINTQEVFDEILSGLANDIQTTSFLTALKSKNANSDEITAAILSSKEALKAPSIQINDNNIENIIFNETAEYIDISLACDLICSSCDIFASKYSFEFNKNPSFEILSLMGINVKKELSFDMDFENINFAYFYLSNSSPYAKYSENIRKTLPFENIFDITTKMLNPLKSKNLLLGIKDQAQIQTFANIALKLGNENSIIISAQNNIPFVSIEGETKIAEAWKNKIFEYSLTPDLLGFDYAKLDDIKCNSPEENANNLYEIIQGKLKNSMYDTIILNSALALYITKKTASVMDGIKLAQKTIDSGLVYEKFLQIKKFYS